MARLRIRWWLMILVLRVESANDKSYDNQLPCSPVKVLGIFDKFGENSFIQLRRVFNEFVIGVPDITPVYLILIGNMGVRRIPFWKIAGDESLLKKIGKQSHTHFNITYETIKDAIDNFLDKYESFPEIIIWLVNEETVIDQRVLEAMKNKNNQIVFYGNHTKGDIWTDLSMNEDRIQELGDGDAVITPTVRLVNKQSCIDFFCSENTTRSILNYPSIKFQEIDVIKTMFGWIVALLVLLLVSYICVTPLYHCYGDKILKYCSIKNRTAEEEELVPTSKLEEMNQNISDIAKSVRNIEEKEHKPNNQLLYQKNMSGKRVRNYKANVKKIINQLNTKQIIIKQKKSDLDRKQCEMEHLESELKKEIEHKDEQIEEKRKKLESSQLEADDLKKKLKCVQEQHEIQGNKVSFRLQSYVNIGNIGEENERFNKEIKKYEKSDQRLKEEIETLRKERDDLKSKETKSYEKMGKIDEENERLKKENKDYAKADQRLKEEIENLRKERDDLKSMNAKSFEEIGRIGEGNKRLNKDIKVYAMSNERLKEEIETLRNEIDDLKSKNQTSAEKIRKKDEENRKLDSTIKEHEEHVKRLLDQTNYMQSKINKLEAERSDTKDTYEDGKNEDDNWDYTAGGSHIRNDNPDLPRPK